MSSETYRNILISLNVHHPGLSQKKRIVTSALTALFVTTLGQVGIQCITHTSPSYYNRRSQAYHALIISCIK